uniref:Uncharacterized protein n=1 Tax=Amphimedon queenslandica TaxID=400682 RepID=A0A1X7VL15_AMPQE
MDDSFHQDVMVLYKESDISQAEVTDETREPYLKKFKHIKKLKEQQPKGFVKRKILECEVIFEKDERKEERLDWSKAKQLRILLQEKIEVLGRLDDEMLNELDNETAMEADIEVDSLDKRLERLFIN